MRFNGYETLNSETPTS